MGKKLPDDYDKYKDDDIVIEVDGVPYTKAQFEQAIVEAKGLHRDNIKRQSDDLTQAWRTIRNVAIELDGLDQSQLLVAVGSVQVVERRLLEKREKFQQ